ncbi:GDSL esterase/lipase CPRD49-like [Papaver somniferum]|uniref:GDSL esterase/lipase CPRD49-like n=1 Tax=Papaver somniferum TaxID=3469 RepID=UPI000E700593|nr:GDSL esterase/lipase CPRD49-like [Papaver somniferum]
MACVFLISLRKRPSLLMNGIQLKRDAAAQPSLVIIYFGGNDSIAPHPTGLGPHVPLLEYIENMRKIANHLKGLLDKTRVIYLSPPFVDDTKKRNSRELSGLGNELVRTNENCRIHSEACMNLCKEKGFNFLDFVDCNSANANDWMNTSFLDGDEVHLSSEGSNVFAEEILKVLKEAEWNPSLC